MGDPCPRGLQVTIGSLSFYLDLRGRDTIPIKAVWQSVGKQHTMHIVGFASRIEDYVT